MPKLENQFALVIRKKKIHYKQISNITHIVQCQEINPLENVKVPSLTLPFSYIHIPSVS